MHSFVSASLFVRRAGATVSGGDTVRDQTKERWRELCERAIVEQDPQKFVATIQELLEVLEDDREERRRGFTVLRMPRRQKPEYLSDTALKYPRLLA